MNKESTAAEVAATGTPEETGLPGFIDKGAVAATSVFTLFVTIAGTIAALGGGGARIVVNHPDQSVASIGLVAAGIVLAIVGALILYPGKSNRQQRRRAFLLAVACIFIFTGFLMGLRAVADTASNSDQPTITAALRTTPSQGLQGSASTTAAAQNERLFVEVRGYLVDPFSPAADTKPRQEISELLFSTQAGPTAAGVVLVPFNIDIRPAKYDVVQVAAWTPGAPPSCRDQPSPGVVLGCLTIRMPSSLGRPKKLDITFQGAGKNRVAIVHLAAHTTDAASMVLTVVGVPVKGKPSVRSQALVTSDDGVVDRTVRVPVGDVFREVCAYVQPAPLVPASIASCSPPGDAEVWARARPRTV